MGAGYSEPLIHRGPFSKPITSSSFLGIPVTSYTMPLINPEDGSYMPTCASGPCVQYNYYRTMNSRGRMVTQSRCVRYGPPTRIPQQTNMFSFKPNSTRHSCGWTNPVNDSQYYVAYKVAPANIPLAPGKALYNNNKDTVKQYMYGKTITGGKNRLTRSKKTRSRKTSGSKNKN